MARTVGKLHIDGDSGKCAVFNVDPSDLGDLAPFTNPEDHYAHTHFHSDNDYLEIFYDDADTLTLASSSSVGTTTHMSGTHGLGSVPHGFLLLNGQPVQGHAISVAVANYNSVRSFELVIDATTVSVRETRRIGVGNPVPAITVDLRILLLRAAPSSDPTYAVRIDPDNGVMSFGYGKFSIQGNPKLKLTTGSELFKIPAIARSIDTSGQTLRMVRPDGSTLDLFGYSGSFAGPTMYKVTI